MECGRAAKKLLQKLNDAAKLANCQVCMLILERRFSEDFGRRVYKKQILYQRIRM